jgi:hypothetical protein
MDMLRKGILGMQGGSADLVQIEQEMGALCDNQAPFCGNALLLQSCNLLKERWQVDHNAIANDALRVIVEDAGWN